MSRNRAPGCHGCDTPYVAGQGNGEDYIRNGHPASRARTRHRPNAIVFTLVDDALSPDFALGDALRVFIRRRNAECFIEEVRNDNPELAAKLRIRERELEAGG